MSIVKINTCLVIYILGRLCALKCMQLFDISYLNTCCNKNDFDIFQYSSAYKS